MQQRVSVVVSPRERFSLAERSLESLLTGTSLPHELVYVDAGSPPEVVAYLEARAQSAGFRRIRVDEPLAPNAARNRALPFLESEYVAFVDNDVLVQPGWLEALVRCADETGAGVVAALVLIGEGADRHIHLAGGDLESRAGAAGAVLVERHRAMQQPLSVCSDLSRERCDFAEFHAMLVRRSLLDEVGPLDEELKSTAEHLDLALLARRAGHEVWFEPEAVVTYLDGGPFSLADALYFRTRWSEDWNRRSLAHFGRKWQLDPASPFFSSNTWFLDDHLARCPLPDPGRAKPRGAFDPNAHGYAQTPAQLYRQLRKAGYDDDALVRVGEVCEHAVALYAGLFRACRKPFVCHAIGTASVLAAHGAPLPLVLCGLMHAAYSHGRFGGARSGVSQKRRDQLSYRIGASLEALVLRYTESQGKDPGDAAGAEALDGRDAVVWIARLANELEERLDQALTLTAKPNDLPPVRRDFYRALASRVGVPALADELDVAIEATRREPAPEALQRDDSASFAIDERSRQRLPFWVTPERRRRKKQRRWPFGGRGK